MICRTRPWRHRSTLDLLCGASAALSSPRSTISSCGMQVNSSGSGSGALRTLHPSASSRDEQAHLESASASHRGAAASLLDQSELHGGFRCKAKPPLGAWCLAASTLHPSASGRETSTHTLTPPCAVEQPQACSISRSSMAASVVEPNHLQVPGAWRQALST